MHSFAILAVKLTKHILFQQLHACSAIIHRTEKSAKSLFINGDSIQQSLLELPRSKRTEAATIDADLLAFIRS
jgi:hypothetical protein